MPRFACLAEVTRGSHTESVHWGAVAVVNLRGELLYQAGDPEWVSFTRSALKPLQAIPLVHGGGLEQFGFTLQHTALLCASHSGEPIHVAAVQAMLDLAGCREADLQCGCHVPIYQVLQGGAAVAAGACISQLSNNCSGKHAGFLAYCMQHGLPIHDYLDPDHPLQQRVRQTVAHFCGIDETALVPGTDGCSAPNYALRLSRLAYAYARLAQGAADQAYGDSLGKLCRAMIAHPEMVSGNGRFDLALAQASDGDWIAKGGAEGVQAIGIRSAGLGVAIKVADGNARAVAPVAIAVLTQLGLLTQRAAARLAAWSVPVLTNLRGLPTGEVRACVKLSKA